MGTEFNKELSVFRAILDGLAGERFDVVVTVGPSGDPEALRPYPDNVRIERFIPQSFILSRAAVFVSHSGSGATLGALRAGVPMLAIPQGADQFLNAERIVDTSVGIRLMPDEVSAGAVRDALRVLLDDHRYRDAARGPPGVDRADANAGGGRSGPHGPRLRSSRVRHPRRRHRELGGGLVRGDDLVDEHLEGGI